MPPETPGASCLLLYGYGDCRESNYCNGIGTCVDGQCACPPGFFDTNCSLFVECKYWDPPTGNWSTEGVTSSNPEPNTVVCTTTHLTDFGGIVLFVPPPTPNATPYNYSVIPPIDAISPEMPGAATPAAILVLSLASVLFLADALTIFYLRWRKRQLQLRRVKTQVSPEPKALGRDRIVGGFNASELPVYPLPVSEFEPPTTCSSRAWFVARAEHTLVRIFKPLPPSVPNILTRPEAIQLAFVTMSTALCASVATLVLRQINLSDEDRLLVMTQTDGLVIATYTAALASVVGYLFSYVLASVFRLQRWARLPKMPSAPLKATAQRPRKPMAPKPPKGYHEYTGETILMDDEPTPEQAEQFAAVERKYAAGEASTSDEDADSTWRAPERASFDGASSEEEEDSPAAKRKRRVQEMLEKSAKETSPARSSTQLEGSNRLLAPPQAPGQLEQWHTSRGWLRQLSNLGTGATIGGTFANINQSLFADAAAESGAASGGLPPLGATLGSGMVPTSIQQAIRREGDEPGTSKGLGSSLITFGGAQQFVKPGASSSSADESGAPQLDQWQTSRNWLRSLPALGPGMTIGRIGSLGGALIAGSGGGGGADATADGSPAADGAADGAPASARDQEGGGRSSPRYLSAEEGGDEEEDEEAAALAAVPADVPPIGTLEYADYLDSLEKRKRKLSEKLQKTESGRLYLSAADREAADAEIATMNEQLAADDLLAANIKRANQRVEEQAEAALETMDEEQQAEVALRWEKAHGLQHVPGFRRDRSRLQLQKEAADARKAAKEEKERKAAEEEAAEARAMRAAEAVKASTDGDEAADAPRGAPPAAALVDDVRLPPKLGDGLAASSRATNSGTNPLASPRISPRGSPRDSPRGSPRDGPDASPSSARPSSARGLAKSSSIASLPGHLAGGDEERDEEREPAAGRRLRLGGGMGLGEGAVIRKLSRPASASRLPKAPASFDTCDEANVDARGGGRASHQRPGTALPRLEGAGTAGAPVGRRHSGRSAAAAAAPGAALLAAVLSDVVDENDPPAAMAETAPARGFVGAASSQQEVGSSADAPKPADAWGSPARDPDADADDAAAAADDDDDDEEVAVDTRDGAASPPPSPPAAGGSSGPPPGSFAAAFAKRGTAAATSGAGNGPKNLAKLGAPPKGLLAPKKQKTVSAMSVTLDMGSKPERSKSSLALGRLGGSSRGLSRKGTSSDFDGAAPGGGLGRQLKRQPSAIPRGSAEKKAFAEMAVTVPKKAKFVNASPGKLPLPPPTMGLKKPRDNLYLMAWSSSFAVVGAACGIAGGMALFLSTAETLVALLGWIASCALIVTLLEPTWIAAWALMLTWQANAEKSRRGLAELAEAAVKRGIPPSPNA